MADNIAKPKLQLRGSGAFNGANNNDKTPSPATRLLINHGKPNFTIQRPKSQTNNESQPTSPEGQNNNAANNHNNNESSFNNANDHNNAMNSNNNNDSTTTNKNNDIVVQSTKFNGAFRPASLAVTPKQPHQTSSENEASKVVLRRIRVAEPPLKDGEDDSVPEFIRRQRRIQERLAKENVLDFENRRSGYFTHVLISPTSNNRTSFMETMSSPAVVPSLEIRPPTQAQEPEKLEESMTERTISEETVEDTVEEPVKETVKEIMTDTVKETVMETMEQAVEKAVEEVVEEAVAVVEPMIAAMTTNGHVEEDEVTKAIEEVNRAVAGEDEWEHEDAEPVAVAEHKEEVRQVVTEEEHIVTVSSHTEEVSVVEEVKHTETHEDVVVHATAAVTSFEEPQQNGHVEKPHENGHAEEKHNGNGLDHGRENGHNGVEGEEHEVTISHVNSGPSIPAPDPSGALGVNYEPKTVVSFSKDLGSEPNKYPDTVKVINADGEAVTPVNDTLQELTKLKFEITGDDKDVQVTPILKTE